jgi:hypothetical protein
VPKNWAGNRISKREVKQTRADFGQLLWETKFPEHDRHAARDEAFHDPEWLIGGLVVKSQEITSLGMHRLSTRFGNELCGGPLKAPPIVESQLLERLQKQQLPTGKRCRIHASTFSTRGLALWWSGRTRG